MRRHTSKVALLGLVGVVLCLAASGSSAVAANISPVADGKWEDGSIWGGGSVPLDDQARLIDGYTIGYDATSGTRTVDDLWSKDATLNLSGGHLTVTKDADIGITGQTTINHTDGTLQFDGKLKVGAGSNATATVDYLHSGGLLSIGGDMQMGASCCASKIRTFDYTISGDAELEVDKMLWNGLLDSINNRYIAGSGHLPTFTIVGSEASITIGDGSAVAGYYQRDYTVGQYVWNGNPATNPDPDGDGWVWPLKDADDNWIHASTLAFELDSDGVSPMNVLGSVEVHDTLLVDLSNYTGSAAEILLINNDGTDAILGAYSTVNLIGSGYRLTYTGGDGNDLALLVPEPSTRVLSILALLGLGLFSRKRKWGQAVNSE